LKTVLVYPEKKRRDHLGEQRERENKEEQKKEGKVKKN
jgi:hypothetical protein